MYNDSMAIPARRALVVLVFLLEDKTSRLGILHTGIPFRDKGLDLAYLLGCHCPFGNKRCKSGMRDMVSDRQLGTPVSPTLEFGRLADCTRWEFPE